MPKKESGISLDDAFADDDDIEYAKPKPKKIVKKEIEKRQAPAEETAVSIQTSKPISQIKKGDKIKVDSLVLEVDAHITMIEHDPQTKEMVIECFDPKTDKDYQIRYFSHIPEDSLEIYVLENEIMYNKLNAKKVEW